VKWNSGTDNYGQFNPLVPLRLLYRNPVIRVE
jgi:hypothetical protein